MFKFLTSKASSGSGQAAKTAQRAAANEFDTALSWETSRLIEIERSEAKAWNVAKGAGLIALAACAAVAGLTPLKSTQPFLIRVDNATGSVEPVRALDSSKATYDDAINKFFLAQYVRHREGYLRDSFAQSYQIVGLMSSVAETQRVAKLMAEQSPTFPPKVYGTARVIVQIKSITFLAPNVAFLRFSKTLEKPGANSVPTHWTATIAFSYFTQKMEEQERLLNPLGFIVNDYRIDADVLSADDKDPSAQGPAAPGVAPVEPAPPAQAAPAAGVR